MSYIFFPLYFVFSPEVFYTLFVLVYFIVQADLYYFFVALFPRILHYKRHSIFVPEYAVPV